MQQTCHSPGKGEVKIGQVPRSIRVCYYTALCTQRVPDRKIQCASHCFTIFNVYWLKVQLSCAQNLILAAFSLGTQYVGLVMTSLAVNRASQPTQIDPLRYKGIVGYNNNNNNNSINLALSYLFQVCSRATLGLCVLLYSYRDQFNKIYKTTLGILDLTLPTLFTSGNYYMFDFLLVSWLKIYYF